jgi:hypothetical protein
VSTTFAVASDAVARDVRRAVELAWAWGAPDGQRLSVAAQESWLYAHWFTRARPTPALPQFAPTSPSRWRASARPPGGADGEGSRAAGGSLDSVVPRVRAAHAGLGLLERGWVTHSVDSSGDVVATRDGTLERVAQSTFANLSRSGPPHVGDSLAVTRCAHAVDADGVWWSTWTRQARPASNSLMRVYWNCGVGAVAQLVSEVTRAFDESGWPYSLKCPTGAALFARVDPVVPYVTPDVWRHARAELKSVHERLGCAAACHP